MGTRFIPRGLKTPGSELYIISTYAEVKNKWSYISPPPTCLYGMNVNNSTFLSFTHYSFYSFFFYFLSPPDLQATTLSVTRVLSRYLPARTE